MKILLLGGTGTLSSEVLKCSILHRYSVSILNRGKNNVNVDKDVSVYISDLRFPKTVDAVLSKETFDVIVDFYQVYSLYYQNVVHNIFLFLQPVYIAVIMKQQKL